MEMLVLLPPGGTSAIPAAFPEGSLTATPRTGPDGTCGRVLPWPMGLGSVLERCHWKIPPAGTLVSRTFSSMVLAGAGVGVGVGIGVGVGRVPAETDPLPPQPHDAATVIANKTIHSLAARPDL